MTRAKSKDNAQVNRDENDKDTTLQQDIDTHLAGNSKTDSKDEGEVWAHFTYSKLNELKKKAKDTTLQQDIDTH